MRENKNSQRKEYFMRTRRLQKGLALCIISICLMLALSITSMAATITTLKITVEGNKNFEYPTVEVRDNRYEITEQTSWSKAEDELVLGDKISCTITVMPKDGNSFKLREAITVKGAEKKGTPVKKDGGYVVKITYTVAGKLEVPQDVWWDDNEPWIAKTEEVSGATGYEFELWQGDSKIGETVKTAKPSCNLAEKLAKTFRKSNVRVKVRAVCKVDGVTPSRYVTSERYEYWGDLQEYCNGHNIKVSNSSYSYSYDIDYNYYSHIVTSEKDTEGQWRGTSGNWYFYRNDGSLAKGKIMYQGNLYYLDENGKMVTGEAVIDGRKYYFNDGSDSRKPEGAALIGLCNINGNDYWYYRQDGTSAQGRSYKAGERATDMWIRLKNRDGKEVLKMYFDSTGKCTSTEEMN